MRRHLGIYVLLGLGTALMVAAPHAPAQNWPMFGGNPQSTSANPEPTGITASNVGTLRRRQVELDGVVDASAIYLHGAAIGGERHDAIFVTTSYGKTLAVDANSGDVLWEYTPPSYRSLAGTRQFTTATPVAAPDARAIYAASPDGYIQKLAVSDGRVLWRTAITELPLREKIPSPLKFFRGRVIAVTGGYIGDRPPYQGHVAMLDGGSGKLLHVWNSLCSNRAQLMPPASCAQTQSAIWGRAGAVIDPADGHIFVATGNGDWNGTTDWGDALIELNSEATEVLGNYTPTNTGELNDSDLDLGSASPVLLDGNLLAQGGKDGKIRLLSRGDIAGATPHKGHELQIVSTPGDTDLFAQPAVWRHGSQTWMFAADEGGTAAWQVVSGKLHQEWRNATAGTSPFEAGGLLFVYDPSRGFRSLFEGGGLNVYDASSGKRIATLPCGGGHWNSPIVVDGKIILPEGDANRLGTSGVLDVWTLPAR